MDATRGTGRGPGAREIPAPGKALIRKVAYDRRYEPPAPVIPLLIASPLGGESLVLPALLDTGADCTLVPRAVARALHLPEIDEIAITGVGGGERRATVHAARLEFGGGSVLTRVAALGTESILGRDLLNRVVLRLDGPRLALSLHGLGRRTRTRKVRHGMSGR
jgi:predicted aspartyl protease